MRAWYAFIILATFCVSFISGENSDSNLIVPGVQAGPIRLGYTTIEEARDSLHSTKPVVNDESKDVTRAGNHCVKGKFYEYYLVDSSKGIIINAQCKNLHVVYEVRLFAPCKWKTADGFGIGSSFDEIKAKMGTPDNEADTSGVLDAHHDYSVWHRISYKNIRFISLHEMDEEGGCCVDLIDLTCDKVIRPDAGAAFRKIHRVRCPGYD